MSFKNNCWLDIDARTCAAAADTEKAKLAYYEIVLRCDGEHAKFIKSVGEYDSIKALRALREKYEGKGVMAKMEILQRCLLMRHDGYPGTLSRVARATAKTNQAFRARLQ